MLKRINVIEFFSTLAAEFTGCYGLLPWTKILALLAEMESASGQVVEKWTVKYFLEYMEGHPSEVLLKISPRVIALRWKTGGGHSVKAIFRSSIGRGEYNPPSTFFLVDLKLGEEASANFYPVIREMFCGKEERDA